MNSDDGKAMVVASNGKHHIINLSEWQCNCLEFQDKHMACYHAIAVCQKQNLEAEHFVSGKYSIDAYQNTYQVANEASKP